MAIFRTLTSTQVVAYYLKPQLLEVSKIEKK
jgi:hypothetical protein